MPRITFLLSILKRLFVVAACFAGSGLGLIFAVFALNAVARFGSRGLLVVFAWLLAVAALCILSLAWVLGKRLGKQATVVACTLGAVGLLAFPAHAALAGGSNLYSEFSGALGMELLVTFPAILLAIRLASFHATNAVLLQATNEA